MKNDIIFYYYLSDVFVEKEEANSYLEQRNLVESLK